jgi:S-(hydroxymethyl)glutathione dehydrogenase / alcohol dehydrogenase
MRTPAIAILLRAAFAGLCHPDPHFMEGHYPFPTPAGHDGAALVEAAGEGVGYVTPGDHVITCLSVFRGECPQCLTGLANLCENTEVMLLRRAPPELARRSAEPGDQSLTWWAAAASASRP